MQNQTSNFLLARQTDGMFGWRKSAHVSILESKHSLGRQQAALKEAPMSQLIAMIARVEDPDKVDTLTEVWSRSMPVVTLDGLEAVSYLDG